MRAPEIVCAPWRLRNMAPALSLLRHIHTVLSGVGGEAGNCTFPNRSCPRTASSASAAAEAELAPRMRSLG